MSRLIEQVAKEIITTKYNIDTFTAGDLSIIHDIYDECIKRGMKPCSNSHPLTIRKRILQGMKSNYLFNYGWFPESICKKCIWFRLKVHFANKSYTDPMVFYSLVKDQVLNESDIVVPENTVN